MYQYFLIPFFIITVALTIMSWLSWYQLTKRPQKIPKSLVQLGVSIASLITILWILSILFTFYGFYNYETTPYKAIWIFLFLRLVILSVLFPISWLDVQTLHQSKNEPYPIRWDSIISTSFSIAFGITIMLVFTIIHLIQRYRHLKDEQNLYHTSSFKGPFDTIKTRIKSVL